MRVAGYSGPLTIRPGRWQGRWQADRSDEGAVMRRNTKRGLALVGGVVVIALVGWRLLPDDTLPEATGQPGDACEATGPVGLVGLDAASGAERWTNVIGTDLANVWTPGPDGDVTSGDSDVVYAIGEEQRIRRIDPETGSVEGCTRLDELSPEEVGRPLAVDATGAFARDRTATAVEVQEADGTSRWVREGRVLVASSTGGVATTTNLEYEAGPPQLALEVLEPATGELRWAKEVPGLSGVATATHLVILDQFGGTDGELVGPGGQVARITAYDLADGDEAWHVDVGGTPDVPYADAGLVLIPGFNGAPTLTAIDDATGEVRWRRTLSQPGRGGIQTEAGVVTKVAVAGDVVVAAVESQPPHHD